MNVREKLIELLGNDTCAGDCGKCEYNGNLDGCINHLKESMADHLIANGVTVQRWIPVTERLPQEDMPLGVDCETVQVLLDDGTVTVGYCNRGLKVWVYLQNPITNFVVGSPFSKSPVKAWKHLSKPPMEDAK